MVRNLARKSKNLLLSCRNLHTVLELFGKSKSVPDRMLTSYRIFEKLSIMQVSTSEGNNDEWENCRWESGDSKNTCVKFCSNCNENLVID